MPNNTLTLVDLMQRRGDTPLDRKVVDDVAESAPLFNALPAKVIQGTTYKYMRRDSIPMIGARPLNAGAEMLKSSYSTASAEAFAYDGMILVDKMLAEADPDGKNALMAEEMRNHLRGTLFGLEQGLIYGKDKDKFGTWGLVNLIADYMTMSADPDANTESTRKEGGSSIWFINANSDYMHTIYGNSKTITFGPEKLQDVPRPTGYTEGENGHTAMGSMEAYIRHCSFWFGFALKSVWAVGRIMNESASNPCTDALLAQMLRKFPAAHKPTHMVINQATLARWEESRTKALTYVKGRSNGGVIADTPTEFRGLKVIVTDALLENETAAEIAKLRGKNIVSVEDFMDTTSMLINNNKPA